MNVIDVLDELGVPHTDRGASDGWVHVDCPFCGVPGKPGMGVHLRTGAVSCFKCGKHRLGDVLAAVTGKPLRDVMPLVAGLTPGFSPADGEPAVKRVYTPPAGVGPLGRTGRDYLARRGLDPDECAEKYGFGWIGNESRLKFRVFLPVFHNRKPVSWTTRAVGSANPRYLSARPDQEAEPLKSLLYGEDFCRHAVCVVEGPLDAVRIGPGAAATFGLAVTPAQVARIARYPVRYLVPDNEPEAGRAWSELADQLAAFPGTTAVVGLTTGKDPASAAESEIEEIRALLR